MSLPFNCPKCHQRLTVTTSKPGEWIDCPNCEAAIVVPGAVLSKPVPRILDKPAPQPTPLPPRDSPSTNRGGFWADRRVQLGIIAGGAALLLTTFVLLVIVLQKPTDGPSQVQSEASATSPQSAPPATPPVLAPPAKPVLPVSRPTPSESAKPPHDPPPQQSAVLPVAPDPRVVGIAPPHTPDYGNLDQFGNPTGQDRGLAKQGEFKGQRLLFWSPHTGAGDVFFARNNPMWKALEDAGFTVRREFGKFNTAWLKTTDQLWILSTATEDILAQQRADIMQTPEEYLDQLKALTAKEVDQLLKLEGKTLPPGWSARDFIDARSADVGMSLSPCFHLTPKDYDAIVTFAKSGKGLCLLADNDPFTNEADELANRLFGVRVAGNYPGEKIAYLKNRLPPEVIRKFKGDYGVDGHSLLTGVYFVYEGITISNVTKSEKLDVALRASDGKAVVAVSKVPGLRVVIDCGFTRYCHGTNERTSYIMKTAGTLRLAQNIAAFLAGKDE